MGYDRRAFLIVLGWQVQDFLLQKGQKLFSFGVILHIEYVVRRKQEKEPSNQVGTLKHQTLFDGNEVLG